ncbi:MAG: hypothetical protein HYX68_22225 [Planctomycetes bacterium]|nr:hypothetical protein [Planctomycetota bacterium]
MNDPPPSSYRLDHASGVPVQINQIKVAAKSAGKLRQFIDIMKEAVSRLETDPHGWGDPEYRSKAVDAVVCHGLIRPVVFHYVIYEAIHAVVILNVKMYTAFD